MLPDVINCACALIEVKTQLKGVENQYGKIDTMSKPPLSGSERMFAMERFRQFMTVNIRCFKNAVTGKMTKRGFTFVEILVVVVILAIAAMVAIPMAGSAANMQIKSAANMIAADLEYAKSMAITTGQLYSVEFDTANETYSIKDQNGSVIGHPLNGGAAYVVNLRNDSRLSKVDINSVSFDSTTRIKFDYLGSPYNGSGNPLNSGVITLRAGTITITVRVEPVTGYISII